MRDLWKLSLSCKRLDSALEAFMPPIITCLPMLECRETGPRPTGLPTPTSRRAEVGWATQDDGSRAAGRWLDPHCWRASAHVGADSWASKLRPIWICRNDYWSVVLSTEIVISRKRRVRNVFNLTFGAWRDRVFVGWRVIDRHRRRFVVRAACLCVP